MSALCRVEDIPDKSGRGITASIDGVATAILVVRLGRTVRAYVNRCPHLELNLDWQPDHFFDFERKHILCGMHGALFRVGDGVCIYGPCLGRALTRVAIDVVDGEVRLA
ncbi:MAG: Rieske 2Fe-2S domain-containing protein [Proteobacteria bacterium]|nr:Rieske 2Fe-2S domain-containing protein [Pseudomonadota bacterium]